MSQNKFITDWFSNLTNESISSIDKVYHENAYFKDPFNVFNTRTEIHNLYQKMFLKLESPRFIIDEEFNSSDGSMLLWRFHFKYKGKSHEIKGASHLKFQEGKIISHRDYWDVGEELLLKIPVIRSFYKMFIGVLLE